MTDVEAPDSRRPALVKLTRDLRDLREELVAGFESRRDVLEWLQRLAVRTLGTLSQSWFDEWGRQFRSTPGEQKVLVAGLMRPDARVREMDDETAESLRLRLAASTIRPAYHRAYRHLRRDAGEYVGDDAGYGDAGHDPHVQRFIAMRPALDELEAYQQAVLADLIGGLDDREELLDWGDDVQQATHGEIPERFISRCYEEGSTRDLLLREDDVGERGRELFAATFVIPFFNRGVRDLSGRSAEEPDEETTESGGTKHA
jgi:hypothetical protein